MELSGEDIVVNVIGSFKHKTPLQIASKIVGCNLDSMFLCKQRT